MINQIIALMICYHLEAWLYFCEYIIEPTNLLSLGEFLGQVYYLWIKYQHNKVLNTCNNKIFVIAHLLYRF